jgi:hypothetical protein
MVDVLMVYVPATAKGEAPSDGKFAGSSGKENAEPGAKRKIITRAR